MASRYRRHSDLTTMFLEVIMTPKTVPKIAEKNTEINAILQLPKVPTLNVRGDSLEIDNQVPWLTFRLLCSR